MTRPFYNPYQFIAVDTRKNQHLTPYANKEDLQNPANLRVRHDYWHKDSLSGRIRCTLTTLSPVVVGNQQTQGNKANGKNGSVSPYQNREGQPAIPANSLRGMISSITEAISQSSLRVLIATEQGEYSVRKPAQSKSNKEFLKKLGVSFKPLKNIGLVCKQLDNSYKIYPLADQDQGLKAWSVGDYLDKRDKPEHVARWRRETELMRKLNCYQHVYNPELLAYEGHQSGVYYIRGNQGVGKRRETYIPWNGIIQNERLLPIKAGTVQVLETILRTLSEAEKKDEQPHKQALMLPKGYAQQARGWKKDDTQALVLDGDLVYYRTENNQVVEISYSSIWRKAVEGSLYAAFRDKAGINSLPWFSEREALTPAEALFGVIEHEPDTQRGGARNLAARVRFTDANPVQPVQLMETVILKILNSPKPPSPALYFSSNGTYVAKTELNLNKHKPNGRKYYLPHPRSLGKAAQEDWATALLEAEAFKNEKDKPRPHMHLSCTPIPSATEFSFDIHFENLSEAELGLLLTALQPLGEQGGFIHRLGLGKPIGLGHVHIKTQVDIIARSQRYKVSALGRPRYHTWHGKIDQSWVDNDALLQLQQLGDAALVKHPVCYPFTTGQDVCGEKQSFKWFGTNDSVAQGARHQALKRVVPNQALPTLLG